jgi:hypothetical protein
MELFESWRALGMSCQRSVNRQPSYHEKHSECGQEPLDTILELSPNMLTKRHLHLFHLMIKVEHTLNLTFLVNFLWYLDHQKLSYTKLEPNSRHMFLRISISRGQIHRQSLAPMESPNNFRMFSGRQTVNQVSVRKTPRMRDEDLWTCIWSPWETW